MAETETFSGGNMSFFSPPKNEVTTDPNQAVSFAMNITPWKINMEPTNHPVRKENDLPNLHDYVRC